MHPFHGESQDEPTYDTYPPYLLIDLPALCDEAAMQFSALLKELSEQFDAHYEDQIRRALRRRRLQESRRAWEHKFLSSQLMLPMFEGEPEF
jgi:hypothetical protein